MTKKTETAPALNCPEVYLARGKASGLEGENAKFNGVIALAVGYIANAQGWNGRRAAKDPKSWAKIAEAGLLQVGVNPKTAERWRAMFTKAAQHMGKVAKNTLVAMSYETDADSALRLMTAYLSTEGVENFTTLQEWYSPAKVKPQNGEKAESESATESATESAPESAPALDKVESILAALDGLDAPALERIMAACAERLDAKAAPQAKAA